MDQSADTRMHQATPRIVQRPFFHADLPDSIAHSFIPLGFLSARQICSRSSVLSSFVRREILLGGNIRREESRVFLDIATCRSL